jgi:pimeloyl-ACP methyl ester carboxylesterase
MAYAELGGVRLFYTEEGSGEVPVVLLHGWTGDSHDWSWQIPALARRHRVVAVDLRGHGRSSAPEDGYDPRTLASDVVALLEHLGLKSVVVMGHGLGGSVASLLALEHPRRVRAIVTVDAKYGFGVEMKPELAGLLEVAKTPEGYMAVQGLFGGAFHSPDSPEGLRTWHLRRIEGLPNHVLWKTLEGLSARADQFFFRPDAEALLPRRRCPVLAFRNHPDSAQWEKALAAHPYSESVCWEGSAHYPHQERPEEFNARVERWLAGLPVAEAA